MRRVVAFNWPKLVAAAVVIAGAGGAAASSAVPWRLRWVLLAAAVGSAYLLLASMAVSWWIYDQSELHSWMWLRPAWPPAGSRWALVHAGFDEAGPALPAVFGWPEAVVDIAAGLAGTARSLRRAQRTALSPDTSRGATVASGWRQLPLRSGTLDAVVVIFAAHEVRDRVQRSGLFAEFERVLRPGGRVILVEHLRDGANVAAFGPAAWHFQTRRSWIDAAEGSGLGAVTEVRHSCFVRGLVLCRP